MTRNDCCWNDETKKRGRRENGQEYYMKPADIEDTFNNLFNTSGFFVNF
jgi:hypothetical protein